MAVSPAVFDELVRFWQSKGVPPCAEAQADGVPCPTLGRQCETCGAALEAMEAARTAGTTPPPEPGR